MTEAATAHAIAATRASEAKRRTPAETIMLERRQQHPCQTAPFRRAHLSCRRRSRLRWHPQPARFSVPSREFPQPRFGFVTQNVCARHPRLALFLLVSALDIKMIRGTVLSVALVLAVGNVSLLCRSWCDPQAAAARGCHSQGSSSSAIRADDAGCADAASRVAAVPRKPVRIGVPAPHADHATGVPSDALTCPGSDSRLGPDTARTASLDRRPLSTTLRI